MQCLCPTCKQPIPSSDELLIDAVQGIVQRSGRRAVLHRGLSFRVLAALCDAYPDAVRHDRLIDAMYGDDPHGGALSDQDMLRVTMCKMRPPLRTLGVHIRNGREEGYRLEFEPFEDMEKAA